MNNLQLFAEGEGDGSGAGDGNEDGAGAGSGDNGNEVSFDDFLKEGDNRAEYDRRIQKAVNAAVTRAQEKWKALTDDKLSEAEKLAKMTKEEKAEYKTRQLEKELADLKRQNAVTEMAKTARKMLADEEINIPDELLGHLVSDNAEDTKTAVESFPSCTKQLSSSSERSSERKFTEKRFRREIHDERTDHGGQQSAGKTEADR